MDNSARDTEEEKIRKNYEALKATIKPLDKVWPTELKLSDDQFIIMS